MKKYNNNKHLLMRWTGNKELINEWDTTGDNECWGLIQTKLISLTK